MTSTMALAISTPTSSLLHSSSTAGGKPSSLPFFSNSAIPIPKDAVFQHLKCIPQLGFTPFSQWNGLKNMGISISQYSVNMERKRKYKGKGVYASLFGVGAPEILVIGVVALLVFGPKGLAEVARNLGKTLRAFQPTIRELQEVSREFKSTLEREIGLDDIDNPVPKSPSSNKSTLEREIGLDDIDNPVPKSPSSNATKPTSDNKPEESGTNIDLNADVPSSENGEDTANNYLKVRADRFTGALAQLQKEQEEEKEREKEQAQSQVEQQTPSEEADASRSENPDNNALEEAASVATKVPPLETETQT